MTKTELKSIIKECLLEILTDGLGAGLNEVKQKKNQSQKLMEEKEHARRTQLRKKEIADSVSLATNDPVLREVFAHTANVTMREQMDADRQPQNYSMQSQVSSHYDDDDSTHQTTSGGGIDISSIFGGAVSKKWENNAFSSKKLP